jgi:hypothetical protein
MKFDIWLFFKILSRKFKFHYNRTIIQSTSREDHYTFSIIALSFLFRMKNISDKSCRETRNTYFVISSFLFFSKILPFLRLCGKILYSEAGHRWQYGSCALYAGYLRLKIHTGCVKLFAFPLQQWSQERASMLRCTQTVFFIIRTSSTSGSARPTTSALLLARYDSPNQLCPYIMHQFLQRNLLFVDCHVDVGRKLLRNVAN